MSPSATTKTWKPFKRQSDFLSLPDTIFEALYGGSAGGGKTETLLMLPIVRQFYQYSRFKMLFLRRTFPELDNEVIPRSQLYYPSAGFKPYQDQKKRWTHPSGAIIQFGHCEHEKDVAKYDTSEFNIIAFDEATSFTRHQYLYLVMSRCRSADSNLPAFSRAGTNPGNVSHSFFRDRFVKPALNGYTIIKEDRELHGKKQTLKRIFIPSRAQDNTYLMQNDPDYIARLNSLPSAERAAKLLGDWYSFSGQVFDEFSEIDHVIEPFDIPEYWPRVLSIDWGYSANTVAGWYAINPLPNDKYKAKIYKYREYVCQKTKISEWASNIRRLSQTESLNDIVLDPSAWGNRGDEYTIAEQFYHTSGYSARKADNDRIGGKLLLQELLRLNPRVPFIPKDPFNQELYEKLHHLYGPKKADDYKRLFDDPIEIAKKDKYLPQFQIFNTCVETIKTIPLCTYKRDPALQTETNELGNIEDVNEFPGDDAYDETRYGLKACQNYLDSNVYKANKETEIANAVNLFQSNKTTSAMLMFQMKMRDLNDSKEASGTRRFHGSKGLRHANW